MADETAYQPLRITVNPRDSMTPAPWETTPPEGKPGKEEVAPWDQLPPTFLETAGQETSSAFAKANRDYIDPLLGLPMDVVGWVTGKGDMPGGRKWWDEFSRSKDVPPPTTPFGKAGSELIGQTASAVTQGGILGGLAKGAGSALGSAALTKTGEQLSAPVANAVAAAGSTAGGGTLEEMLPDEAAPYGRFIGGLFGSMVGGGMAAPAGTATAADKAMATFERLGLTPTAATTGIGGRTAELLESNVLPQAIGSANRMHKVAQENLAKFSQKQQEIASKFGGAKPKYDAGVDIQDTILEDWKGRQKEAGDILNAIGSAFTPKDQFVPLNILKATNKPFAAANTKTVQQITNAPEIEELSMILDQTGGTLTYADMKALKAKYAAMLGPGHDRSVNEGQVGQIVKALDDDMEAAVKSLGNPDVTKAWQYAKATYNNAMQDYRKAFKKLLGTEKLPIRAERVYDILVGQAGIKSPADIEAFETVWRALGKQKQGDLAATVLSHMGNKDPAKLGDMEGFSLGTFLTNYKNISPAAKKMLFRSTGNADLESSLDDLLFAAERMGVWDKLASSSRSGIGTMQAVQVGGAAAAATGDWLTAVKFMVLDFGGPWAAAQVLTRPALLRQMAKTMNAANESGVGAMRALMALEPMTIDPDTGKKASEQTPEPVQ